MKGDQNDIQILDALRSNEAWAFEHIYNLYVHPLYYFVERIVKDTGAAEDITSESFMKLFGKSKEILSDAGIKSFLFTVARNASLDYLKSKRIHQSSHEEIRYLSEGFEKDVEDQFIVSEVLQIIHKNIQELPLQCRRVLELALIEGRSNEEIAEAMNIAYKSVQNNKTRGLKLLRKALAGNILLAGGILVSLQFLLKTK